PSTVPPLVDIFVAPQFARFATGITAGRAAGGLPFASGELELADLFRSSEPHAVILGDMGAGKSSVLRYVALAFAREEAQSRLRLSESRLPLLMDLGEYAARRGERRADYGLLDYFVTQARETLALGDVLSAEFFAAELEGGAVCVCLDGLDKVGARDDR